MTAIRDWCKGSAICLISMVVLFLCVVNAAVVLVVGYGVIRPACYARGAQMVIDVSWSLWTDCMINVKGKWLPWSEVVPVERNGKIVFEPKPCVRLAPPATQAQ